MSRRRVLVTGCSSGIGRATAISLAEAGMEVFAGAREPARLASLAGVDENHRLELDVADPGSVARAVAVASPVDVLVNNAGFAQLGAVEEVSDEELRRQYEVNLFGPWRLCRAVLGSMRERGGGTVVNVSSYGAEMPYPAIAAYRSSKAALEAMSAALRLEVARFGIRVIVVQPGLVDTAFPGSAAEPAGTLAAYEQVRDDADSAYDRMSPAPGLDPAAVAQAIREELEREAGPLRVAVGADAVRNLEAIRSGEGPFDRYLDEEVRLQWRR